MKLNGLLGGGPIVPLSTELTSLIAGDGNAESIDPNLGKVALIGEREFPSKLSVEITVWEIPLIPSPEGGSSGIGVGGVGVRGGAGMGRLEAIAVVIRGSANHA